MKTISNDDLKEILRKHVLWVMGDPKGEKAYLIRVDWVLYFERRIIMAFGVSEVQIKQVRGYLEVYVNGEFFCSTDSYIEAVNELYEAYGL